MDEIGVVNGENLVVSSRSSVVCILNVQFPTFGRVVFETSVHFQIFKFSNRNLWQQVKLSY